MDRPNETESVGPGHHASDEKDQNQRKSGPLDEEDHRQGKPQDDDEIGEERNGHVGWRWLLFAGSGLVPKAMC